MTDKRPGVTPKKVKIFEVIEEWIIDILIRFHISNKSLYFMIYSVIAILIRFDLLTLHLHLRVLHWSKLLFCKSIKDKKLATLKLFIRISRVFRKSFKDHNILYINSHNHFNK